MSVAELNHVTRNREAKILRSVIADKRQVIDDKPGAAATEGKQVDWGNMKNRQKNIEETEQGPKEA